MIKYNRKKLEKLIALSFHYNIPLHHFDSFFYRGRQDKHPFTIILYKMFDEIHPQIITLGEVEIESLYNSFSPGSKVMLGIDEFSNISNEIIERFTIYFIANMTLKEKYSIKKTINSFSNVNDSILIKTYKEISSLLDKDGLITFKPEINIFDYGIQYKSHILLFNQLLRRGYFSNFNYEFLTRFIRYYHQTKQINKFKISLDLNRLVEQDFFQRLNEYDTWIGSTFQEEKLDDSKNVGLTVVQREKESLFWDNNALGRTEFFSYVRDDIKTFEFEEINNLDGNIEHYYINKYIHSERDIETKIFTHLDGAVKIYLKDSYQKRYDSKMPKQLKCYKKIKLFRIDGNIDLDNWLNIVSYFFKGNEMVIRYFDPEQYEKSFDLRTRNFIKWKELQENK